MLIIVLTINGSSNETPVLPGSHSTCCFRLFESLVHNGLSGQSAGRDHCSGVLPAHHLMVLSDLVRTHDFRGCGSGPFSTSRMDPWSGGIVGGLGCVLLQFENDG